MDTNKLCKLLIREWQSSSGNSELHKHIQVLKSYLESNGSHLQRTSKGVDDSISTMLTSSKYNLLSEAQQRYLTWMVENVSEVNTPGLINLINYGFYHDKHKEKLNKLVTIWKS